MGETGVPSVSLAKLSKTTLRNRRNLRYISYLRSSSSLQAAEASQSNFRVDETFPGIDGKFSETSARDIHTGLKCIVRWMMASTSNDEASV